MRPIGDVAGGGSGEGGEAGREALVERIAIVRIAVMAQIPDRQDRMAPLRLEEWIDGGEIVTAAAPVDERPGNPLARASDAELPQHPVILVGMGAMLGLLAQVSPPLVLPDEGRAFEARQEEG